MNTRAASLCVEIEADLRSLFGECGRRHVQIRAAAEASMLTIKQYSSSLNSKVDEDAKFPISCLADVVAKIISSMKSGSGGLTSTNLAAFGNPLLGAIQKSFNLLHTTQVSQVVNILANLTHDSGTAASVRSSQATIGGFSGAADTNLQLKVVQTAHLLAGLTQHMDIVTYGVALRIFSAFASAPEQVVSSTATAALIQFVSCSVTAAFGTNHTLTKISRTPPVAPPHKVGEWYLVPLPNVESPVENAEVPNLSAAFILIAELSHCLDRITRQSAGRPTHSGTYTGLCGEVWSTGLCLSLLATVATATSGQRIHGALGELIKFNLLPILFRCVAFDSPVSEQPQFFVSALHIFRLLFVSSERQHQQERFVDLFDELVAVTTIALDAIDNETDRPRFQSTAAVEFLRIVYFDQTEALLCFSRIQNAPEPLLFGPPPGRLVQMDGVCRVGEVVGSICNSAVSNHFSQEKIELSNLFIPSVVAAFPLKSEHITNPSQPWMMPFPVIFMKTPRSNRTRLLDVHWSYEDATLAFAADRRVPLLVTVEAIVALVGALSTSTFSQMLIVAPTCMHTSTETGELTYRPCDPSEWNSPLAPLYIHREIIGQSWGSLVSGMSNLFVTASDEQFVRFLLRVPVLSMLVLSSILGIPQAQEAIIRAISRIVVPNIQVSPSSNWDVQSTNSVPDEIPEKYLWGTGSLLMAMRHACPALSDASWAVALKSLVGMKTNLDRIIARKVQIPASSESRPSSGSGQTFRAISSAFFGSEGQSSKRPSSLLSIGEINSLAIGVTRWFSDLTVIMNECPSIAFGSFLDGVALVATSYLSEDQQSKEIKKSEILFLLEMIETVATRCAAHLINLWDKWTRLILETLVQGPQEIQLRLSEVVAAVARHVIRCDDVSISIQRSAVDLLVEFCFAPSITTRVHAIRAVHQVIVSSGHRLNASAWPPVLLAAVLATTVALHEDVTVAFGDLAVPNRWPIAEAPMKPEEQQAAAAAALGLSELIISDFGETVVSCVPSIESSWFVSSIAAFAMASTAPETFAFRAVALLWNLADAMGRKQQQITSGTDHFWCHLIKRLVMLANMPSVEIRHCALRSLFSVLAARGSFVSKIAWQDELVPTVCVVVIQQTSQGVARNLLNNESELITPSLLLHHSRDSSLKEWAETAEVVTSGMTRLVVQFKDLIGMEAAEKVSLETISLARALVTNAELPLDARCAALRALGDTAAVSLDWELGWQTLRILSESLPSDVKGVKYMEALVSLCNSIVEAKIPLLPENACTLTLLLLRLIMLPTNFSSATSFCLSPKGMVKPKQDDGTLVLPFEVSPTVLSAIGSLWKSWTVQTVCYVSKPQPLFAVVDVSPSYKPRDLSFLLNRFASLSQKLPAKIDEHGTPPTTDSKDRLEGESGPLGVPKRVFECSPTAAKPGGIQLAAMNVIDKIPTLQCPKDGPSIRLIVHLLLNSFFDSERLFNDSLRVVLASRCLDTFVVLGRRVLQITATQNKKKPLGDGTFIGIWIECLSTILGRLVGFLALKSCGQDDQPSQLSEYLGFSRNISETIIFLIHDVVTILPDLEFECPTNLINFWGTASAILKGFADAHASGRSGARSVGRMVRERHFGKFWDVVAFSMLYLATEGINYLTKQVKVGSKPQVISLIHVVDSFSALSLESPSLAMSALSRFFVYVESLERDDIFFATTAKLLLVRCKRILENFVRDDLAAGQCPLPQSRLDEITVVLLKLERLGLTVEDVMEGNEIQRQAFGAAGKAFFVLFLFPQLVDCVSTKDPSIRVVVQKTLNNITNVLGLKDL